jgi:hypothetical protein
MVPSWAGWAAKAGLPFAGSARPRPRKVGAKQCAGDDVARTALHDDLVPRGRRLELTAATCPPRIDVVDSRARDGTAALMEPPKPLDRGVVNGGERFVDTLAAIFFAAVGTALGLV